MDAVEEGKDFQFDGFQVECGSFKPRQLDCNALVISQGWPSWTFALEGLGFKSVSTLASFDSVSSREEFLNTEASDTLISQHELNPWLEVNSLEGIIFVQGDQSFLESVHHKQLNCIDNPRLVYICTEQDVFTADGVQVSHHQVGGVTDGKWTVYIENLICSLSFDSKVKRTLGHILSTTEGTSYGNPLVNTSMDEVLKPEDLIPWNATKPIVLAKSVFHKNEKIKRYLSFSELMNCYDIELSVQESFHKLQKRRNVRPTKSFAKQVPVKVLRSIATNVVMALDKDDLGLEEQSIMSSDSERTIVKNNLSTYETNDDDTAFSLDSQSLAGEVDISVSEVAAKHDDAEAEPEEWDAWSVCNFKNLSSQPVLVCTGTYDNQKHPPLFNALRKLLIRRYRRNVLQSLLRHLKSEHCSTDDDYTITIDGLNNKIKVPAWIKHLKRKSKKSGKLWNLARDLEVGKDAVSRAANSTWWSWDSGSTLFYWRWPRRCRKDVRDGTKLYVDWDRMPRYMKKQQWPKDEMERQKLEQKIRKVRGRGYVQPGFVRSLTGFFAVPKAGTDIRVVYDATQCGLNDALWAPNFFLPTVDSILRNASAATWFGDIDLGEMFLNYTLDLDIRQYAGIDVTGVDDSHIGKGVKRILERWCRTLMGFKPSPYVCTQTFSWSEEIIVGDHSDCKNPFFWDQVILNLPGMKEYNPVMPRVYRWNSIDNCMACFFGTYIDDIRSGGPTERSCRETSRRIASRINYLGQQDAVRKRGHPAKTPRAWAGAKCEASEKEGLFVLSTDAKWAKSKAIIVKWLELLEVDSVETLSYTSPEKDVGFLCHISRTYPAIFPYLKGFYNTLNGWRVDRDTDGWKIGRVAWMELLSGDIAFDDDSKVELPFEDRKRNFLSMSNQEKPSEVKPATRLCSDLTALKLLFSASSPTKRLVRGSRIGAAIFGFGDASGTGFGSSWESKPNTSFRFGTWGKDMEFESSNLRELKNLVDTLEEMSKRGELTGCEIFLFTDNSTAEAAFFNGSSKSQKLFDLVLQVRKLEMDMCTKIHLCHVAGERMKVQGSDGLSRGNLNVGVMAGKAMMEFVPIHLGAIERHEGIKEWIESWTEVDQLEWLNPSDWFVRGHDRVASLWETNIDGMKLPVIKRGVYVWAPAPAAAEAAVEELRRARHKRQASQHLFIVPRLMQPEWRKQLYKASDLVVTLPPGHHAWPSTMFEPLTIAFVFPFLRHRPWQLRGSIYLLDLGRQLSRLWRDNKSGEGPILRELWGVSRRLSSMPEELARKVLYSQPIHEVSNSGSRKRRRSSVAKVKGRASFLKQQKRGHDH
jgi:hypothetical protein